jgi:hypothetical protein
MSAELQLWAIEFESAGGLSAEHTYVSTNGHNFNCFGRSSGGRLARKANASSKWACLVYGHQYKGLDDSGLPTGLSIRYDGVCQNVANRILVLADDDIDARETKGNAFATLMYGKFGFNGISQYIQTVKATGAQLLKDSPGEIDPSHVQVVLDRITYGQTPDAELEILHADAQEQEGSSLPPLSDARRAAFRPIYSDYQNDRSAVFASTPKQPGEQIAYGKLRSNLAAPWAKCVDRLITTMGPEQFKMMFGVGPDTAKLAFA